MSKVGIGAYKSTCRMDLAAKTVRVEARFSKNGQAREVALGDVALSILEVIRPANPSPTDHVFLGRADKPIRSVREGFDAAVLKVWKPSTNGERKPRFHDLRKTGATRVEAVSSPHAVARRFLGHADEDVTSSYLLPSLDAVRDAMNRAASSIDGKTPAGVLPFPGRQEQGAAAG